MIPDVMVDLETLSSAPNAAVVSIGAVQFDAERGIIPGSEFYEVVDTIEQTERYGRHISAATFAWWTQQSEAARKVFVQPALDVATGLSRFAHYMRSTDAEATDKPRTSLWGNGADFDCVVLAGLYEAVGMPVPWSFRGHRCFRTLKNLGIKLEPGEGISRADGVHHNALDDAKYQAHYAVAYLRKLKGVL